jgi:multidrug efflux system outer membrane protein
MLDIDKARAQYRIQRAALLPAVDATGQLDRGRVSDAGSETGHSQVTRNYVPRSAPAAGKSTCSAGCAA